MKNKICMISVLLIILFLGGCDEIKKDAQETKAKEALDIEQEKKAILKTLNNETKAAFQRNYGSWEENWVHDSDITKIYIDFPKDTFSESKGWKEISEFVKIFFEEHPEPEPEPVPELLNEIDVRLYGNGAWVTYEQLDSLRGLKREARLMEKINGKWRIAGMQTTIYGFKGRYEYDF